MYKDFKPIIGRHSWMLPANIEIDRPQGNTDHGFIFFRGPIHLKVGNTTVNTDKQACLFIRKGTPLYFTPLKEDILNDWLHFSGPIEELLQTLGMEIDTVYYPMAADRITSAMAELERELLSDLPLRDEMLHALFLTLATTAARCCLHGTAGTSISGATLDRFREFRVELLASIEHSWTVKEMAERMNFSVSRFTYLYTSIFGVSPKKDLINARVERAKLLLRRNKTVEAVADALGYSNEYNFIRQFKSVTGITPGRYANRRR